MVDGAPAATSPLVNGQAAYSTASLAQGKHEVRADYGGDGPFEPSASATLVQTVNTDPVPCDRWDLAADFRSSPNQENPGRDSVVTQTCGTT